MLLNMLRRSLPVDHHCLYPGLMTVDEDVRLGGDVRHQDGVSELLLLLSALNTPEPPQLTLHEVAVTDIPPGHIYKLGLLDQPLPVNGPHPKLILQHDLLHTGDNQLTTDSTYHHIQDYHQRNLQRFCVLHLTFT